MPFAHLNDIVLNHVSLDRSRRVGGGRQELVMVHGLGANLGFWYLQIAPMLARYSRVTLYDLRGHGLSGMPQHGYTVEILAADMRALFDHLGIESAHVVAHSFGGSVASRFACENMSRVRSLTLVETRLRSLQPQLRLDEWAYWPRYRELMNQVGLVLDEKDGEFGIQLFDHIARMRLHDPERADRLSETLHSPFSGKSGKRSALRWLQLQETTSAREEFTRNEDVAVESLRSLRMPIMGIYGEYSHTLLTAQVLPQLCPQALIQIVPRAGHFFPLSMPEKVVAPVLELLGQDVSELAGAGMPPWGRGAVLPSAPSGLFMKE